jgi:DNA polymerase-3 subunit alpha
LPVCLENARAKGLTKGIFQLESNLGKHWCKELKPESIEHLTALASILRPGALQAYDDKGINTTQHYCLRKNGAETVTPFHKSLKEILEPTYQLNIYQEGSMEICKKVAGFNLQEADEMRKLLLKSFLH